MTVSYSTKGLDHLGLVSGMCKDIGIAKFIDAAHPNQSQDKHISYGQVVEAMILNGQGFVGRTLHMYPEYFADRPVERLIGKGVNRFNRRKMEKEIPNRLLQLAIIHTPVHLS